MPAVARRRGGNADPRKHRALPRDARKNDPALLEAISSVKSTIHFETYVIHRHEDGLQFAEAPAGTDRNPRRLNRTPGGDQPAGRSIAFLIRNASRTN